MLIQTVEVKNLWGKDILWDFNEDVNVLIGENGVGKSTVLRLMSEAINPVDNIDVDIKKFDIIDEIVIKFTNGIVIKANSSGREIIGVSNNNYSLNFSHIDTFDVLEKSPDPNLTYLDYLIAKLEGKFVKYQRDIATEVERVFMSEDRSTRADKLKEIEKLYDRKNIFLKIIKEWFGQGERNKIFDDKRFLFITNDSKEIIPKFLSSGEKQALIIFLTVLLENEQDFILIMDEPEISLHISWQRHLINKIRELNPNCQLIISTHSPTVFYASWQD
ncbi:MAG: putative ATP-binding protein involved in virulence, partial [Arenicella sp.]